MTAGTIMQHEMETSELGINSESLAVYLPSKGGVQKLEFH